MMQVSEGAVFFDGGLNYGIGGQTSKNVLDRSAANSADMKARGARFCTVLVGTNDLNDPAVTEKQVVDNTAGICTNLIAQGVTPIVIPILPRAYDGGPLGTAITPERQRTLQRWANGQRNYAKRTPGVMLFDPTTMLTDHSDALGYPGGRLTASALAFTSDGLHITARSAFPLGRGVQFGQAVPAGVARAREDRADCPFGNGEDAVAGRLPLHDVESLAEQRHLLVVARLFRRVLPVADDDRAIRLIQVGPFEIDDLAQAHGRGHSEPDDVRHWHPLLAALRAEVFAQQVDLLGGRAPRARATSSKHPGAPSARVRLLPQSGQRASAR